MTSKDRTAFRVLQSQIGALQARHDQFWRQASDNGWLADDAFKRQLMGFQHDVSSSIMNAQATIRSALTSPTCP